MLWNFQTFSCWLKLPNMAEWQFVFQMWDGVLPNPWDYESLRVPREMQGDVFLERDIPGIIRRVHAKAARQYSMAVQFWQDLQDCFALCYQPLLREEELQA
ncbi:unnamed protein product [Cladocopium goreaui]|uniref:Uncharacterized protein n=1 Tax=Cladocopium goreaui TaxID=2562237 RepID=A0A9P1C0D2_9DINO|nr:unnamed protein product [Cladocopium goreaui]